MVTIPSLTMSQEQQNLTTYWVNDRTTGEEIQAHTDEEAINKAKEWADNADAYTDNGEHSAIVEFSLVVWDEENDCPSDNEIWSMTKTFMPEEPTSDHKHRWFEHGASSNNNGGVDVTFHCAVVDCRACKHISTLHSDNFANVHDYTSYDELDYDQTADKDARLAEED